MKKMIVMEHVSKRYGAKEVLKGVNLSILEGRAVCLMGASGSGKTTLLRLIAGLERQDAGRIAVAGTCSMVFQDDRLLTHLSALANLRFVAGPRRDEDARAILKAFGLETDEEKPVSAYSGGMSRRVALGRAMLAEYEILLLDEPFKGLDEEIRLLVAQHLLKINRGRTLVMVSHDPREAELLQAEVIYLGTINRIDTL